MLAMMKSAKTKRWEALADVEDELDMTSLDVFGAA